MQENNSKPAKTRRPLSRQKIGEAAIALADDAGLKAVTMRAVAAQLGVEAMSLYNHVKGKPDLLTEMTDVVAGQIAIPQADGDWRAEMSRRARSAHAVLLAHPWAAELVASNPEPGPRMLAYVEATLACLSRAGFGPVEADHAWNAMDSYIYGFTLQAIRFPFAPDDYADVARENLDMIPADSFPNLRQLAELVAGRQHDGLHRLEFGFDLLLDGLGARCGGYKSVTPLI